MGYVTRFTPHAQRDMLKISRQDALRVLHRLTELQKAMDAGYDHVAIHQVGPDQEGFIRFFEREVMPEVRRLSRGSMRRHAGADTRA